MLTQPQQPELFINKLKPGAGKYSTTTIFQMVLVTANKNPNPTIPKQK